MTLVTFDLLFSIYVSTFSACVCAFAKKKEKRKERKERHKNFAALMIFLCITHTRGRRGGES